MRIARLTAAGLAGGALLVLAAPLAASAHVTVTPSGTAAGSYTVLTFAFSHGCDGSPTTALAIDIPESIESVSPTLNPNWTIEKVADGDRTAQVVYTAITPVEDGYRDTIELSLQLPEDAAGETLAFPVLQTCAEGETNWNELAEEGAEEPESPAPTIVVTEATGDEHGHGAATDDAASDGARRRRRGSRARMPPRRVRRRRGTRARHRRPRRRRRGHRARTHRSPPALGRAPHGRTAIGRMMRGAPQARARRRGAAGARRVALLVAASVALVAVPAVPASAHNYVVATTPAEGAVVTEQPGTISLETNDELLDVGDGSAIQVQGPDGLYYGDGCTDVVGCHGLDAGAARHAGGVHGHLAGRLDRRPSDLGHVDLRLAARRRGRARRGHGRARGLWRRSGREHARRDGRRGCG